MATLSAAELPRATRSRPLLWRLASDAALARGVATGHDAAFAVLFDRHHPALVRYCRSILLDAEDAADAAQAAFTSALRALRGGGSQPTAVRPWLYAIARHEAYAIARRRSAGPVTALDEEAAALAAPDDAATRERLRDLLADLRTLPERQRQALVLRELEGLRYEEIGAALGMSAPAARQAVFEARGGLQDLDAGRGAACADVRHALSDGDGRTRRARHLRAHLDDCDGCRSFAASLTARRRALRAIFPLGPGLAALATGGGGAAVAGGGAAMAGGGWALAGIGGASVASKCVALCATAAVLGGSFAALEHHGTSAPRSGPDSATARATPLPRAARPNAVTARPIVLAAAPHARPAHRASSHVAPARRPSAPRAAARAEHVAVRVQSRHAGTVREHAATAPATSAAPAPAPATTPAQQAVTPAHQAVQQAMTDARDRTQAAIQQAEQRARDAMTQAQEAARRAMQQAAQSTQQALDAVRAPMDAARTILQQFLQPRTTGASQPVG
jgi:RNA polymerase sigma factor (sigma-70 family)